MLYMLRTGVSLIFLQQTTNKHQLNVQLVVSLHKCVLRLELEIVIVNTLDNMY